MKCTCDCEECQEMMREYEAELAANNEAHEKNRYVSFRVGEGACQILEFPQ